ncbi:hypothetical protein HK100_012525 [Physocladia obscura]|uniref:Uncharacterized protein n=1 Tax=Physocladia obscura TaxID=109957 RepID=A0AAD5XLX0_9FUNG|nr:hypothetical protein HK100_012525 [Physocladia obscura]
MQAEEFKNNHQSYFKNAQQSTKQHAMKSNATVESSATDKQPDNQANQPLEAKDFEMAKNPTNSELFQASDKSELKTVAQFDNITNPKATTRPILSEISVPEPLRLGGSKKRLGLGMNGGKGKKSK